ncbi:MAG: hypothetical protein ACXAC7_12840 [Candidatus Hodarchaeales archaeon]|jgi:hypothetical protein
MSEPTNPFEEARVTWKGLSVHQSWIGVFGDLYVQRYPTLSRGSSAETIAAGVTHSLFDEDDSVHAFKAHGVRQTILKQLVAVEERGYIRPWYIEAGLFAERSNLLRAFKEEDIDFICRLSLIIPSGTTISFPEEYKELLKSLDPPIPREADGSYNEFELTDLKKHIIVFLRPQIEFFGILKGIERSLFPLSQSDIFEVVDLILDPEMADIIFRKRFIEEDKKIYPLVGEGHDAIKMKKNFITKYICAGNAALYPKRAINLWLYSFLLHNQSARDYLRAKGAAAIEDIDSWVKNAGHSYKELIWRTLNFIKFEKVFLNSLHNLRTEYATKAVFSEYATDLYHLLNQRDTSLKPFEEENGYPFPVDIVRYELKNLLVEIGETLIDSILTKLANEIPDPRGIGLAHFQRSIMIKRRANMEREVAPPELQTQLLEPIVDIGNYYSSETQVKKIEKLLRTPHDILAPRGEKYFEEMKARVEAIRIEIGKDFTEEIADQLDTPQSLIRQFGPEAHRFTRQFYDESINYSDLYGLVLTLKSVELLFDEATLNVMRKKQIIESLLKDFFTPQLHLLKRVYADQTQRSSISKEEEL